MQIATGSYVGDGSSSRGITGIGFQPQLVIVRGNSQNIIFRTAAMVTAGDTASYQFGSSGVVSILSLDSDGFTVNNASVVNLTGTTYNWIAVCADSSNDFAQGTYSGNSSAGHAITGLGFAPSVVSVKRAASGTVGGFHTTSHPTTSTSFWSTALNVTDFITALGSDGFTLGINAAGNASGGTYYWFAFSCPVGTYVGNNATDDRNISSTQTPDIVCIKGDTAQQPILRTTDFDDDSSAPFNASANASNRIQRWIPDGFQIGTNAAVNGTGVNIYWFALKKAAVKVNLFERYYRNRRAG